MSMSQHLNKEAFVAQAANVADELIKSEIARQDRMWGAFNERTDISDGQLFDAGHAQLWLVMSKADGASPENALRSAQCLYPEDWGGFRDYGSDVANLVVAVAFLRQEIKRRIMNGEDTTRTSRNPETQPYTGDQPNVIEP